MPAHCYHTSGLLEVSHCHATADTAFAHTSQTPSLPFVHTLCNHIAAATPSCRLPAICYSMCHPAPACVFPTLSLCSSLCVCCMHTSITHSCAGDLCTCPTTLSPIILPRVSMPPIHTTVMPPPVCCHTCAVLYPPRSCALPACLSRSASTLFPQCAATPVPTCLHPHMLHALISISTHLSWSVSTLAPLSWALPALPLCMSAPDPHAAPPCTHPRLCTGMPVQPLCAHHHRATLLCVALPILSRL
jgi:hypothetical protein